MIRSKFPKLRSAAAPAGELPRCERCENIELRRQGRVGFLERAVLPRFGFFPWECGLCRDVTYRKQRSAAKVPAERPVSPVTGVPESPRTFAAAVPAARLTIYAPPAKRPSRKDRGGAGLPATLQGSLPTRSTAAAR